MGGVGFNALLPKIFSKLKTLGMALKRLSRPRATRSGFRPTLASVEKKINRGIRSADELDALKNPLKVTPVKIDLLGRPSQRFVGRKAEVVINPKTGRIPSVNPTSTAKARRLSGG